MKILIVEDDRAASAALYELIHAHHCSADIADDGLAGLALAEQCEYDVIVIDVQLPKLDGISLCRQLRERGYSNSILILTAHDATVDRVAGLDAGADDYMAKPYEPTELLARMRSLARRSKAVTTAQVTWENLCLDSTANAVSSGQQTIHLTPKEYCLLELFIYNPQRIFSRSAILDKLWDFTESPGEQTVCTHIKCVRQKLRAAGVRDPIETVHGLGYRLRPPQTAVTTTTKASQQKIQAKTARIWEKFKGKFLEQVLSLAQAAALLRHNQLTPAVQEQARHDAHSLAGSLGIFGFMTGSRLAKQMENIWRSTAPISIADARLLANLAASLQQELRQTLALPINPTADTYQPTILIIDEDLAFADRLRSEALLWGFQVEVATNLSLAKQSIDHHAPDVILLDLSGADAPTSSLQLLQKLVQRVPRIPIVAFTGQSNIAQRLALMEAGGHLFLEKPLAAATAMSAVSNVLHQQQQPHCNRVLIVDDDPIILARLAELLEPHGVDVTSLPSTQQFWEVLQTKRPNLLILDSEMPDYQGADLCKVVRSDGQWQDLPIVFLSAHDDHEQIDRAFLAGADDYWSKSIAPTTLVHNILRRLKKEGFQPQPSA
jgi:DNA-binding response OmpR family regulator